MPTQAIDVSQLRWRIGNRDVTCENCHTALFEPSDDEVLCPACRYAFGEDLLTIVSRQPSKQNKKRNKKRAS